MEGKTNVIYVLGKPYPIVTSKFKDKSLEEVLATLKCVNMSSFGPSFINQNNIYKSNVNASILSNPVHNCESSKVLNEIIDSPTKHSNAPSKICCSDVLNEGNTNNVPNFNTTETSFRNINNMTFKESDQNNCESKNQTEKHTKVLKENICIYNENINKVSTVSNLDEELTSKNKAEDQIIIKNLDQNSSKSIDESGSASANFHLSSSIPNCSLNSSTNTEIEDNLMKEVSIKISQNLSISEPVDILAYSKIEWRGKTVKANLMCQGYKEITSILKCRSMRRVRGDNYCAFRSVAFHVFSQINTLTILKSKIENTAEYISATLDRIIYKLDQQALLENWNFAKNIPYHNKANILSVLGQCLKVFSSQLIKLQDIPTQEERLKTVFNFFNADNNLEIYVFEAMKLLMLEKSICMYNQYTSGGDVPTYVWLLFARDTSSKPIDFLKNHLNMAGDTSGLEQVSYHIQIIVNNYI